MNNYTLDDEGRELKNPLNNELKNKIKYSMYKRQLQPLTLFIPLLLISLLFRINEISFPIPVIYMITINIVIIIYIILRAIKNVSISYPIIVNTFERQELYKQNVELPEFLKHGAFVIDLDA